jgi:hypothetical protein
VTWIERAKARYPKNRRLLLWAVSQEPELYSKARAHGFEGTGHEAFRHWCKSNLEPGRHKGNKEILAQYLAGVFKAKQAKLMLATAENACNRLVNGRCIDSILLKTLTRHYSSMDVPVDPRLRWQLLAAAAERFSPAKGDLSAAARRMKQDVTNLEKAILKGKGTKHT